MAKFVFEMQGILNIKQKLEEQQKTAYGLARMRLSEEEERLNGLFDRKEHLMKEKTGYMQNSVNPRELNLIANALMGNELAIEDGKRAVRRAQKALDTERIKLENAMKERKMYEKLREKRFEQFLAEEDRKERLEIDELVSYRYGTN